MDSRGLILQVISQLSADIDDKLFKKISYGRLTTSFIVCCHQCVTLLLNLRRRSHPFVLPVKCQIGLAIEKFSEQSVM